MAEQKELSAGKGSKLSIVVILGSAPSALQLRDWQRPEGSSLVAINNAWKVREDWDFLIHAGDFPDERKPDRIELHQSVRSFESYVPAQNRYGGFVYAGGTMAFTAGYWALDQLKPEVLAYFACDMTYSGSTTHFYGAGQPDPLREDKTLRSLEAKSARLMALASRQGCRCVNLSNEDASRLVFPRHNLEDLLSKRPMPVIDQSLVSEVLHQEQQLGYFIENGEYWHHMDKFDDVKLAELDRQWLQVVEQGEVRSTTAKKAFI